MYQTSVTLDQFDILNASLSIFPREAPVLIQCAESFGWVFDACERLASCKDGCEAQSLLLQDFNITNIPLDTFQFPGSDTMVSLHISYNQIGNIETGAFRNLTSLRYMYASHNRLEYLQANLFQGLTSLEYLDISSNNIRSTESETFRDLYNLQTMILSENNLSGELSGVLGNYMSNLVTLHVSKNRLESVDERLEFPNLETLNLDSNSILRLGANAFDALSELQTANLAINNISVLHSSTFSTNRALRTLFL